MSQSTPKSPLRALLDIERKEVPLALLMFSQFFLIITSFWILKPLKKTFFIQFYDQGHFDLLGWVLKASQAELLAKVLNMVVAFVATVVFTWLARKLLRERLMFVFTLFFMLCFCLYGWALLAPGAMTVWSFYLFGDLFNTVMLATFFAFLNDSVSPDAARRLYGIIVLGGVLGGVFGSSFVKFWIGSLSAPGWMAVCFALSLVILASAFGAGKLLAKEPVPRASVLAPELTPPKQAQANPALEGARMVFGSPYLLSIVGVVGLYEIVSTLMDFQFTETIAHYLDGPEIGKQFSAVYSITNIVSLVVQLLLTSALMSRFRLTVPLLVQPTTVLLCSGAFMLVPALWVGSSLSVADNALSYSINQSAKEALYTPTSRDAKYKAKAFIDMFVQRFAKALAVGVSLLVTTLFTDFSAIRWLSIATIAIGVCWWLAARYAGTRFQELTQKAE